MEYTVLLDYQENKVFAAPVDTTHHLIYQARLYPGISGKLSSMETPPPHPSMPNFGGNTTFHRFHHPYQPFISRSVNLLP
jgi:hypothetical protein